MNSSLSLRRAGFITTVLFFLFSTISALAADTPAGTLAFTVYVPGDKLSQDDITMIVRRVSIRRGWTIKETDSDRTVIYLNQRKNEATVTYLVTRKEITAYCEGYATNGSGVRRGPEQPTGWLGFLKKDLGKALDEAVYLNK
jgi:hypothetical protein